MQMRQMSQQPSGALRLENLRKPYLRIIHVKTIVCTRCAQHAKLDRSGCMCTKIFKSISRGKILHFYNKSSRIIYAHCNSEYVASSYQEFISVGAHETSQGTLS